MDKESLLARWMADEITDAEFRKHISQADFLAYKKLKLATELYAQSQEDLSPDLFDKIQGRIEQKQSKRRYILYRSVAAVAAVLLLFAGVNKFLSPSTFVVETGIAQTKRVDLPDETVVVLSPGSVLKYKKDWKENNREVYLEGTAYFEVTKAGDFQVKTPNGSVKVLGTKFNVVSMDDWLKVECFEGKVLVTNPYKTLELKPNTSYNMIGNQVRIDIVKEDKPAWLSGESRFKSVPLKYVLQEIQNHYAVKFINQGVDENVLFTGSFVHNDLDLSLKLVLKALQINYKKKDKNTIVMMP